MTREITTMYRTGHYGAALLFTAPVIAVLGQYSLFAAAVVCGIAVSTARLPDMDVWLPIKHRGITHTAVFTGTVTVLVFAAVWTVTGEATTHFSITAVAPAGVAALGVALGLTSHLASDVITPSGIPLWYPVSSRSLSLYVTEAKNPIANHGLLLVGAAAAGVAFLTL